MSLDFGILMLVLGLQLTFDESLLFLVVLWPEILDRIGQKKKHMVTTEVPLQSGISAFNQ